MEEVKDFWIIISTQEILEKVSFGELLTKEQAIRAYKNGDFEDIVDTDMLEIISVESAE